MKFLSKLRRSTNYTEYIRKTLGIENGASKLFSRMAGQCLALADDQI